MHQYKTFLNVFGKKQLNLSQGEFKNEKLNNQSVFSLVSNTAGTINFQTGKEGIFLVIL